MKIVRGVKLDPHQVECRVVAGGRTLRSERQAMRIWRSQPADRFLAADRAT